MKKDQGNKMMIFMSKRMIACDEASYLVSLSQDKKIGLKRWMQLKMHLLTCHLCRKYEKQIIQLSVIIKQYSKVCNNGSCQHHLDEASKIKMQGVVNEELNLNNK